MKIAVLMMSVLMIAIGGTLIANAASSASGPLLNGDNNCDGTVTVTDGLVVFQALAGLQPHLQPGCPAIGVSSPTGPVGMSRDNPVARGDSYIVPEGWELKIVNFKYDATQDVLNENQFNSPPRQGHHFSIVRVKITNVSATDPANPDPSFAFRMVGSENVGYTTFGNSCGVIPDPIPENAVFRGGSVEGNVCYEVVDGESAFKIYTDFSSDANKRWFDVGN
jgi:hypothetical protein